MLLTFRPSTIIKGLVLELDEYPRIWMLEEAPGAPEEFTTWTPAALPCMAVTALVVVRLARSLSFTDAIAPVTSLFLWTP